MILLIDANYIAHAARHTMKELTHDDIPTGVIYGFLSRIFTLAHTFQTNEIIFCWDSPVSFRKDIYPLYKANRRKQREEQDEDSKREYRLAIKQFDILHKTILPSIGFANSFQVRGYEGDDIIAHLAYKCEDAGMKAMIVSPDNDMFQLLRPGIAIYNPATRKKMTHMSFEVEYNIEPSRWSFVKAIAGCPTDNVIGVKGVGIKRAIQYLNLELKKTSKAYKDIQNSLSLVAMNDRIVSLPLSGMPRLRLRKNKLNQEAFNSICEQYGMVSLLSEWEKISDAG